MPGVITFVLCRVSVTLANVQFSLNGGVIMTSAQAVGVTFDQAKIATLLEFIARFPHEERAGERVIPKHLLQQQNNRVLCVGGGGGVIGELASYHQIQSRH